MRWGVIGSAGLSREIGEPGRAPVRVNLMGRSSRLATRGGASDSRGVIAASRRVALFRAQLSSVRLRCVDHGWSRVTGACVDPLKRAGGTSVQAQGEVVAYPTASGGIVGGLSRTAEEEPPLPKFAGPGAGKTRRHVTKVNEACNYLQATRRRHRHLAAQDPGPVLTGHLDRGRPEAVEPVGWRQGRQTCGVDITTTAISMPGCGRSETPKSSADLSLIMTFPPGSARRVRKRLAATPAHIWVPDR